MCFQQGLIFIVDEHAASTSTDQLSTPATIISPSSNLSSLSHGAAAAAHVLLPDGYMQDHPRMKKLFRDKNVQLLNRENLSILITHVDKLRVVEILLTLASDSLHIAAAYLSGGVDIVSRLLGIPVDSACPENRKNMLLAVDDDNLQLLEPILNRKNDIKCVFGRLGYGDLLLLAAETGPVALVKSLLEHGADANCRDASEFSLFLSERGFTALHYAVLRGCAASVGLLVEKGADVNARKFRGETPLHLVRHLDVAEILLENGADVNALQEGDNADFYTPLISIIAHHECQFGTPEMKLDIVKLFVKYGCRLDTERIPDLALIGGKDSLPAVFSCLLENCFSGPNFSWDVGSDLRKRIQRDWRNHGMHFSQCGQVHADFVHLRQIFACHAVKLFCLYPEPNFSFDDVESWWLDDDDIEALVNDDMTASWLTRDAATSLTALISACEEEVRCLFELFCDTEEFVYDVITSNVYDVACLMRNDFVATMAETIDWSDQFPLYGSMLKFRLDKGRNQNWFQEVGCRSFDSLSECFRELPEELKGKLISYLRPVDIMTLRRVSKLCAKT